MWFILVTLDTSHLERSPLNDGVENNKVMSITAETSQDPIGPCGPLEQSVEIFRHSLMAAWSSLLDLRPVVGCYYMGQTFGFGARVTMMIRTRVWARGFGIGVE